MKRPTTSGTAYVKSICEHAPCWLMAMCHAFVSSVADSTVLMNLMATRGMAERDAPTPIASKPIHSSSVLLTESISTDAFCIVPGAQVQMRCVAHTGVVGHA